MVTNTVRFRSELPRFLRNYSGEEARTFMFALGRAAFLRSPLTARRITAIRALDRRFMVVQLHPGGRITTRIKNKLLKLTVEQADLYPVAR